MLAKAVALVPEGDFAYEPKWDGFRCLIFRHNDDLLLISRNGKNLTEYFPELHGPLRDQLPSAVVLDGELVVPTDTTGLQRLDWDALTARIHPASSRIATLAEKTPARFVAFDVLAHGNQVLLDEPFIDRRATLEVIASPWSNPLHLTASTTDHDLATKWLSQFEGAGLDGVIAKPIHDPYQPGKRAQLKIKHRRTADTVVVGYRSHKSGDGVGSLLLGLYDDTGELRPVGGAASFSVARRRELLTELQPYVKTNTTGETLTGQGDRSRFTGTKDVSYVVLRPELVAEVAFDQLEKRRFRHTVRLVRFRPDKSPQACTFDQVDTAVEYDLTHVLSVQHAIDHTDN